MLTIVGFVLRLAPATAALEQTTNAISNFLGPPQSLLFHEACESRYSIGFGVLAAVAQLTERPGCILPTFCGRIRTTTTGSSRSRLKAPLIGAIYRW